MGAAMLPKRMCDVQKCEVARFVKLSKDSVQLVSLTIPRKVCYMRFVFRLLHLIIFKKSFYEANMSFTT